MFWHFLLLTIWARVAYFIYIFLNTSANTDIFKKVIDFIYLECTLKNWDFNIIIALLLSLYCKQTNQEKTHPNYISKQYIAFQTEEAIIIKLTFIRRCYWNFDKIDLNKSELRIEIENTKYKLRWLVNYLSLFVTAHIFLKTRKPGKNFTLFKSVDFNL